MVEQKPPVPRRLLPAFSRYRPRALTVVLLVVIAALIVLANLSFDVRGYRGERVDLRNAWPSLEEPRTLSHGWPLVWHRYDVGFSWGSYYGIVGWRWNASYLAADLAMWLAMLAAPAGICEWLLRRYRPRLRWSLRTMLLAIGVLAAICAWIAAARNRVNLQDELIAKIGSNGIWVERRGPRWLDVVGAGNYRRRIAGVEVYLTSQDDPDDGQPQKYQQSKQEDLKLLKRLGRLPDLQYLIVQVDCFTPAMAAELSRYPQLRVLSLSLERLTDDTGDALAALTDARELRSVEIAVPEWHEHIEARSRDCMAGIGQVTQLEQLELFYPMIDDQNLDCLAGLKNLNQLGLQAYAPAHGLTDLQFPLLSRLPPLPRLEAICFEGDLLDGRDLAYLARLPQLKSLALYFTHVNDADTAQLASLAALEELEILDLNDSIIVSESGLESLRAIKRLKTLRIRGGDGEGEGCLRALEALRRSKPGIVIEDVRTEDLFRGMNFFGFDSRRREAGYDTPEGIENSIRDLGWLKIPGQPVYSDWTAKLEW